MIGTKEDIESVKMTLFNLVIDLVDNPKDIDIKEKIGDQTVVYELYSHKDDVGKLIGKQGKMASSLRTILVTLATKHKFRAVMEIME